MEQRQLLSSNDWQTYEKKTALYATIQNICKTQENGIKQIGELPLIACKYYRLVRNGVVHFDRKRDELEKVFNQFVKLKKLIAKRYATIETAPNLPECLNRDDFQLSIRATQDVAWKLSNLARPSEAKLLEIAAAKKTQFEKRWPNKARRIRTAMINFFIFTFGFSKTEAEEIIEKAF